MPPKHLFFPVLRRRARYPKYPRYNKYRELVREDSQYRCVYCDVHELEMGRELETRDQRMTLDHFRPKSLYAHLENEPRNLVLCCPVCNSKKADDWPAFGRPHKGSIDGNVGYVDPFNADRNEYFEVLDDGRLCPIKPPAGYMIRVLMLNRPAVKKIRRRRLQLYENIQVLEDFFTNEIANIEQRLTSITPSFQGPEEQQLKKRLFELKTMKGSLNAIEQMIELY